MPLLDIMSYQVKKSRARNGLPLPIVISLDTPHNLMVKPKAKETAYLSHRTWRNHTSTNLEASSQPASFIVLEGTIGDK